jgi:hypothetical protein
MLKFHGTQPIARLDELHPRAECPGCGTGTRFSLSTAPRPEARREGVKTFVASYACDACQAPIAIEWTVNAWNEPGAAPLVRDPRLLTPVGLGLDRDSLPSEVLAPLDEAASCWHAGAYNAFGWMCWRAIQAMADDAIGSGSAPAITSRIDEAMELLGLARGFRSLVKEILAPEGRARPHLPEMNRERATVLLSVVRDLVYELYTRPARLKDSLRGCRGVQREGRLERRQGRERSEGAEPERPPLVSVR